MIASRHDWDVTPAEARAIQLELRKQLDRRDRLGKVRRVAGIDIGFERKGFARAAICVLAYPDLEPLEHGVVTRPLSFPYIPGLLSFREVPAALAALETLQQPPDLILCDGQGFAHPRRFGLACHLGVLAEIPTIGAAKSRLLGTYGPLPRERGAWVPLLDKKERIGAVLRTRTGVKPLYVSSGHRVSLPTAIRYVLRSTSRYRLPETTRAAHRLASLDLSPAIRRPRRTTPP